MMPGSLILLVLMTLEEGSQSFLAYRSFDLLDGLANIVGIICGEGLVRMLPARRAHSAIVN
jgi:VanZ family protein